MTDQIVDSSLKRIEYKISKQKPKDIRTALEKHLETINISSLVEKQNR